LTLQRKVRQR